MLLGLCFRTDASWNESGYSNPEFDRLLVEAEGKVAIGERKAAMGKLQTILLEDGPIVQPVFRSIFGAYRRSREELYDASDEFQLLQGRLDRDLATVRRSQTMKAGMKFSETSIGMEHMTLRKLLTVFMNR